MKCKDIGGDKDISNTCTAWGADYRCFGHTSIHAKKTEEISKDEQLNYKTQL